MKGLKNEIDGLFILARELEERQKRGDEANQEEVESLKSLTLTIDSIADSMTPEEN